MSGPCTGDRAYVFVLARDFKAALKVWEAAGNTAVDQRRRLSARVAIRVLSGDLIGAQAEAEKARQLLEERLRERPNDISSMTQLSWVYLALKRNSDATKLARQAASLLPPEKDVVVGNHPPERPGRDRSSHRRDGRRHRHSSPTTRRFLLAEASPSRA